MNDMPNHVKPTADHAVEDDQFHVLAARVDELTREIARLRAELVEVRRPIWAGVVNTPWVRRIAAAKITATPVFVLLAFVGVFFVLFATSRHGPGISPDSVNYIGAARDLLTDGDLRNMQHGTGAGGTLVLWPPLFPALIAVVSLSPGDWAEAARLINAAAYGAIVFVAGLWLRRTGIARHWIVLGCLTTLLSYPLIRVSVYAWSEPTFSLWLFLFAVALGRYLESGSRRALLAAAGCAAAAWLTRYVGGSLVLAGPVVVLVRWRRELRTGLRDATMCFVVAAVPGGLWMVRNELVTSTLAGPRAPSRRSVSENVRKGLETVGGWFRPDWFPDVWRVEATVVGAVAIAGVIGVLARRLPSVRQLVTRPDVVAMLVTIGAYFAYLVSSASTISVDPLDYRFMEPIAVPLGLLVVFAAGVVGRALDGVRWGQAAHALLAVGFAVWLVVPAADVDRVVSRAHARGAGGYATDAWAESGMLAYLRTGQPDGRLVSNHSEPIAFYTNRPASSVPFAGNDRALTEFAESVTSTPTYVVWFTIGGERTSRVSRETLQTVVVLDPVATGDDGTIYLAKPKQ